MVTVSFAAALKFANWTERAMRNDDDDDFLPFHVVYFFFFFFFFKIRDIIIGDISGIRVAFWIIFCSRREGRG